MGGGAGYGVMVGIMMDGGGNYDAVMIMMHGGDYNGVTDDGRIAI